MDHELRDSLRRENLRAAVLLLRRGQVVEALDFLEARLGVGEASVESLLIETLTARPESERLALAPRLHRLARRGMGTALGLWRAWFPSGETFTGAETWLGGFYELSLELGPSSGERLAAALRAIWSHPSVEGCYLDKSRDATDQDRIAPSAALALGSDRQFGFTRLPNGALAVCGTYLIREERGTDWLDFCVPAGALEAAYPGGHPFAWPNAETCSWQGPLDEWLADLGRFVFAQCPFALGLIGHEVSGETQAARIGVQGPPEERTSGYLWPHDGRLGWFPVTKREKGRRRP